MLRQTLHLGRHETGRLSRNRHERALCQGCADMSTTGPVYLLHSVAPTHSPVDVLERGGLRKVGTFIHHIDDAPILADAIPDASLDLVTCYAGLHHLRPDAVAPFITSIHRVLRPGGLFVLRDHHVPTQRWSGSISELLEVVESAYRA
jgi:SAM-dependent methyltransferase